MRLRQEIEGEARDELQRARESLEAEGRNSASGKLCATPFGIDVVGISQARTTLPVWLFARRFGNSPAFP